MNQIPCRIIGVVQILPGACRTFRTACQQTAEPKGLRIVAIIHSGTITKNHLLPHPLRVTGSVFQNLLIRQLSVLCRDPDADDLSSLAIRSEERRVGNECICSEEIDVSRRIKNNE